jgi:uncharacterized membrane protein
MKNTLTDRLFSKNSILGAATLLVCIALWVMPDFFQSPFQQSVERYRGRVLEVDNSLIQQYGIVKAGSQVLQVEIIEGPLAGQVVEAGNDLLGKMETDKMFQAGDTALLVLSVKRGEVVSATAYDHYRLNTELLLVILFAVLLVGFAGWGGVRALLSFAFAILMMWKVLLPLILRGGDPVWVALGVITLITAATLYLVAGVSRTALVALLGSLLGILLTIGLSTLLLPSFRLHGAILPFSETLLYSGFEHLNLTRLFLAAIFIGASGAVLDVAIDVSTAMSEVVTKRPDISRPALIQSGFAVGRNMTSTMVTTLLMAYVSGYIALLMIFMGQGVPLSSLLNTNYVAAEILRTVVGSFGLVTVAPFTALVGGLVYVRQRVAQIELQPAPDHPHLAGD